MKLLDKIKLFMCPIKVGDYFLISEEVKGIVGKASVMKIIERNIWDNKVQFLASCQYWTMKSINMDSRPRLCMLRKEKSHIIRRATKEEVFLYNRHNEIASKNREDLRNTEEYKTHNIVEFTK